MAKTYSNIHLVLKILRLLPKSLEPKVTAIEEAKDLKTLSLEHLLGSLTTHEKLLGMLQSKINEENVLKELYTQPCVVRARTKWTWMWICKT